MRAIGHRIGGIDGDARCTDPRGLTLGIDSGGHASLPRGCWCASRCGVADRPTHPRRHDQARSVPMTVGHEAAAWSKPSATRALGGGHAGRRLQQAVLRACGSVCRAITLRPSRPARFNATVATRLCCRAERTRRVPDGSTWRPACADVRRHDRVHATSCGAPHRRHRRRRRYRGVGILVVQADVERSWVIAWPTLRRS